VGWPAFCEGASFVKTTLASSCCIYINTVVAICGAMSVIQRAHGAKVAKTNVRIGPWGWGLRGPNGKFYEDTEQHFTYTAQHWGDLPIPTNLQETSDKQFIPVARQLQVCDNLITRVTILDNGRPLGKGGYGIAYKCSVKIGTNAMKTNLVLKLPRTMVESRCLIIHPENNRLYEEYQHPRTTAMYNEALENFKAEFRWFEKIWEPPEYIESLEIGGLGEDIEIDTMKKHQAKLIEMKQHPGRPYIHEYLHFDRGIPAILTELCDGNLWNLRRNEPALFFYNDMNCDNVQSMTLQLGWQIANAIDYMRTMDVVNTDLKLENIFYKRSSHDEIICKISDFGFCADIGVQQDVPLGCTRFYRPATYPSMASRRNPMGLCVYEFAVLMCELLAFRDVPEWPPHVSNSFRAEDTYQQEVDSWRNSQKGQILSNFMPSNVTFAYEQKHPIWKHIARILLIDFRREAHKSHFNHIQTFIEDMNS